MLTVIDEFTRRCLAIVVARKLKSDDVLHCLTDLFVAHGPPEHIRSDNGPEFVAKKVGMARPGRREDALHRTWQPLGEWLLRELQLQAPRRTAGGELFSTLHEAKVLIESGDGITMRSGRIPRSAIVHRRPKRSCRQRLLCPTLRSGQPRRWPERPEFN